MVMAAKKKAAEKAAKEAAKKASKRSSKRLSASAVCKTKTVKGSRRYICWDTINVKAHKGRGIVSNRPA